jgi:hypothetical protein
MYLNAGVRSFYKVWIKSGEDRCESFCGKPSRNIKVFCGVINRPISL